MQQTDTITHLKGLADHARLSHEHWLRSARQGGSGSYGPASGSEGAGTWRRRRAAIRAQLRTEERAR